MSVLLHCGDCLDVMAVMPENSVDSVITDPPYGINFMNLAFDHGVPGVPFWKEALRVAKPGAMLLAFGGTRTHHRLMVAIEDAGWILRDMLMWVYGSGFPKSHAIGKAIDRAAGAEREVVGQADRRTDPGRHMAGLAGNPGESTLPFITAPATDLARTWDGWGTALKPAWEPIILAMAPLDGTFAQNAEKWGVAGLWIDGARVGTTDDLNGGGYDPDGVSQKDLSDATSYATRPMRREFVQPKGRFPANLLHDGSDEVVGLFPRNAAGSHRQEPTHSINAAFGGGRYDNSSCYGDSGSAARFFYCAKASRKERNAGCEGMEEVVAKRTQDGGDDTRGRPTPRNHNHHPTVKPLALMEYLCKLTRTPTGGIVLDPFMGSGTTGIACVKTGRGFIGIEIDPDYFEIAEARIAAAKAEPVQAEMPMGGGN